MSRIILVPSRPPSLQSKTDLKKRIAFCFLLLGISFGLFPLLFAARGAAQQKRQEKINIFLRKRLSSGVTQSKKGEPFSRLALPFCRPLGPKALLGEENGHAN